MESLKNYLCESSQEPTIYFPNVASALIYEFELSGQISDGYWENARPSDHWKWITRTKVVVENNMCGYTGNRHNKTYNTDWLRKDVKKALKDQSGDYQWTIRVFKYGKIGSILSTDDFNRISKQYAYRVIIENLPDEEVNHDELAALMTKQSSYRVKYWAEVGNFFSDSLLKKYYSSRYGFSEFEDDLDKAEEAINTHIE